MYIYKNVAKGYWTRIWVNDIEYAVTLALNSKVYSLR